MNAKQVATWRAFAVMLTLEAVALGVLLASMIVNVAVGADEFVLASVSLLVAVAIVIVWVGMTARGAAHRKRWSRSSAVTIQLLALAVASLGLNSLPESTALVLLIAVPALVTLALAITSRPLDA